MAPFGFILLGGAKPQLKCFARPFYVTAASQRRAQLMPCTGSRLKDTSQWVYKLPQCFAQKTSEVIRRQHLLIVLLICCQIKIPGPTYRYFVFFSAALTFFGVFFAWGSAVRYAPSVSACACTFVFVCTSVCVPAKNRVTFFNPHHKSDHFASCNVIQWQILWWTWTQHCFV